MKLDWPTISESAFEGLPPLKLPTDFRLPALPQSVMAFTALADDPNSTPRELAEPIQQDSALTIELLRQVNSVAVG